MTICVISIIYGLLFVIFDKNFAMKNILVFVIAICLVSCGSAVAIDYEKDMDWETNKTYQFYNEMKSGLNELDEKRIMSAIDTVLSQKKFQKTDYNQYHIGFFVEEFLSNSRNTVGVGLGTGGRGVSVGGGIAIPVGGKIINQKITIELREATTDQKLVWQAVYEGMLKEKATPQQKEAYYKKIISKMLVDFPPKKLEK